jgi:hypothetical protein
MARTVPEAATDRSKQEGPEMKNKRWMASVLKAAAGSKVAMPWERGMRRALSVMRRDTISAKARRAGA